MRPDFGDDLDDAERCQALHPVPEFCPGLLHARPSEGLDCGVGIPLAQRPDDPGRVEIA
jgi:hypothetical protein